MEHIWSALLVFFQNHLATTHNIFMLVGSWVLVWAAEPLVLRLVTRLPPEKQVTWWGLQKSGKALAAVIWCEVLVWVPTVQPPLCNGHAENCQTVFGRVALGVILGGALSLLHRYVIARLKRAFGRQTPEPPEVTRLRGK